MSRSRCVVAAAVMALLVTVAGVGWFVTNRSGQPGETAETAAGVAKYHCPMHPTMVSDRPGDCPICGMRMVPIEEEDTHEATGHAAPADASAPEAERQAPAVADRAAVRLSAQKQQLIGAKITEVVRSPLRRVIRTVGRVTYDETRLRHVHTKIAGYVERLHANATGELVREGQPLLEIYSPELLASQQEYLVALKARSRTAGSPLPGVADSGAELVASARRRLELFDLTDDQIGELERTGQARRTVTLYAPISGYIIRRNVTQGERIEPGTMLLDVADLSRVWVLASIYEYELPFVRTGQKAAMTLAYFPGRTFEGRVGLIYPTLDAATRTVQVRLEFANPRLELKPEMYAEVLIEAEMGEGLTVPDSAVIETGTRSIVFVDQGGGLFEPREVEVGVRLPDRYQILKGLEEGEKVLTSGNFFVDSESKLKAALAATTRGAPPAPQHQH